MDEHCSINPARMALMQTAEREPVAVATRGFGRQARGARQGGGSRRNNGRGWNVAGATGENGKALGKIRNFENRSTEEVAMPKPTTTPVVSVVTEVLVPATNGVHKRKRDGEDKATIEKTNGVVSQSQESEKKRRKSKAEGQKKEKKDKKNKDRSSKSKSTSPDETETERTETPREEKIGKIVKDAANESVPKEVLKEERIDVKKVKKVKDKKLKADDPEFDEKYSTSKKEKKEKKERKVEEKDKEEKKAKKEKKGKKGSKEKKETEKEKKEKKEKKDKTSKSEVWDIEGALSSKIKSLESTEGLRSDEDLKRLKEPSMKWNATELSGGDARQSKFLRLLGAGKAGDVTVSAKPTRTTSVKQREEELEKQFNAGLKMRNEPNGKRKGLGA